MHSAHPNTGMGARSGRKLGAGEAELLNNYPDLRAEDLVNAWGYYRVHRADIDQQIAENEEA